MSIELPPIEASSEYHLGTKITPASEKLYGYVWVVRDKKSHPWEQVAHCWVAGDVCLRAAQIYFEKHGYIEKDYTLGKLLPHDEWLRYKVNQHLKSVGIK